MATFAKIALIFLFAGIVIAYTVLFVFKPSIGPTDDVVFLKTLQIGKPLIYYSPDFPYFDSIAHGRFQPLTALEYNPIGLISNNPLWYFSLHAVQFLFFAFVLYRVLRIAGLSSQMSAIFSLFLFFLPGFTIPWFRLQLPERNVLFLGILFVFFMQSYVRQPSLLKVTALLIITNIALYFKEMSFLLFGGFAATYLLLRGKKATAHDKGLCYGIIFSSAVYLALYAVIVMPRATVSAAARGISDFAGILKMFSNYALFSDPILVFGLLPLTIFVIYRFLKKCSGSAPLYDALAIGVVCFMMGYFVIRFYSPYYMLPAYAFALPALAHSFPMLTARSSFKILLMVIILFSVFNTVPASLHYLSQNKYLQINSKQAFDFLSSTIRNSKTKPRNVFIEGMPVDANGLATYSTLADFLESYGLSNKDFNLKSTFERTAKHNHFKFEQLYSVFSAGKDVIRKDDLLLLVPQSQKEYTPSDLQSIDSEYRLLYKTRSPFFIPLFTAKSALKNMLTETPFAQFVQNKNIAGSADYSIYEKK